MMSYMARHVVGECVYVCVCMRMCVCVCVCVHASVSYFCFWGPLPSLCVVLFEVPSAAFSRRDDGTVVPPNRSLFSRPISTSSSECSSITPLLCFDDTMSDGESLLAHYTAMTFNHMPLFRGPHKNVLKTADDSP